MPGDARKINKTSKSLYQRQISKQLKAQVVTPQVTNDSCKDDSLSRTARVCGPHHCPKNTSFSSHVSCSHKSYVHAPSALTSLYLKQQTRPLCMPWADFRQPGAAPQAEGKAMTHLQSKICHGRVLAATSRCSAFFVLCKAVTLHSKHGPWGS